MPDDDPRQTIGGVLSSSPWAVSIGYDDTDSGEYRHSCTGVILSPHIVITAAHCHIPK